MTEPEEFWAAVDRDGSGCWRWTRRCDRDGYGDVWWHGQSLRAHRLAYQLQHGPIPDGLHVCHTCDVPACVNPAHLWLGTNTENQTDCTRKGRRPTGDRNGSRTHPESRPRGAAHWKARLSPADVLAIRILSRLGDSNATLAAKHGISKTHVARILAKRAWRDL